jgi:hypothetical protein
MEHFEINVGERIMNIDIHAYLLIQRRSAHPVYLAYRINRYELMTLCAFYGYLMSTNKSKCSIGLFIDSLTGNSREKPKYRGYLEGLITRGCVDRLEYIVLPGSRSIQITAFGLHVIGKYETSVKTLCDRYKRHDLFSVDKMTLEDSRYKKTS